MPTSAPSSVIAKAAEQTHNFQPHFAHPEIAQKGCGASPGRRELSELLCHSSSQPGPGHAAGGSMLSSESAPELKMSLWSEVGEGKEGCSHKYSPRRAGEGLVLSSP